MKKNQVRTFSWVHPETNDYRAICYIQYWDCLIAFGIRHLKCIVSSRGIPNSFRSTALISSIDLSFMPRICILHSLKRFVVRLNTLPNKKPPFRLVTCDRLSFFERYSQPTFCTSPVAYTVMEPWIIRLQVVPSQPWGPVSWCSPLQLNRVLSTRNKSWLNSFGSDLGFANLQFEWM